MGFAVQSALSWRWPRGRDASGSSAALEKLWQAARATRHYRQLKEEEWSQIPPLPLECYYSQFADFDSGAALSPVQRVGCLWQAPARVLVLKPWFSLAKGQIVVPEPSCRMLEKIKPEALAGPIEILRGTAIAAAQDRLSLDLRFGVIVLEGIGRGWVLSEDRNRFWCVFQAPVYREFRGFQGELLAWECEAHDGLHSSDDLAIWEEDSGELLLTSLANLRYPALRLRTGVEGRIDASECNCGRPGIRLRVVCK